MRLLPYGERALLCELEGDPAATAEAIRAAGLRGLREVIPAATTVLVEFDRAGDLSAARDDLGRCERAGASHAAAPPVEIPVRYDGADLGVIAGHLGVDEQGVIDRHSAVTWRASFLGFTPGFAYLSPEDGSWPHLPRLPDPRTSVPAGSVALAAGWSAIYPTASPGGWLLLGRTDAAVWDPQRTDPALLTPGTRVRFVDERR